MRVAIVTESFLPDVNGVANSVVRVAEHLVARGHQPLVIAPEPATGLPRVLPPLPYPVFRVRSVPMPGYPGIRLGLPVIRKVEEAIRAHGADVVHLASPMVLGAWGSDAARRLGIPAVAVYQTDVAGFARARGLAVADAATWAWMRRIHGRAARTLAPSTSSAKMLTAHGIPRVWRWQRGVDSVLFHPDNRDERVRAALAPRGEVIVGYVGRLAREKRVDLLRAVTRLPDVRVVVVGAGPAGPALKAALPDAVFLGERRGTALARMFASLDVFVHTGPYETFCQTVQEAMASGVPVVAPAAGGPLDLVDPARTGLLVPPGDPVALAGAVSTLARDPVLRKEFGTEARAAVAGRTWSAIGDELIGHYHAVRGETRQLVAA